MAKIPVTPSKIVELDELFNDAGAIRNYSLGGNVAWISHESALAIQTELLDLKVAGLQILGQVPRGLKPPFLGPVSRFADFTSP